MKQQAITAPDVRHVIGRIARGLMARGGEGVENVIHRLSEQPLKDQHFHLPDPASKPVVRYLDPTLRQAEQLDKELADAVKVIAPALHWDQSESYTDEILGEGFTDNYAWAELVGPKGFFAGDDYLLGLLLLGPHRHYLDHFHPAPELYWPLTAPSEWRKGDGQPFVPRRQGEVIWHPSLVTHATITHEVPLLAVYCWTRNTKVPARLNALMK
ncbi:MAG: hypothetical protein JNM45_13055 [Rhizobiales bacterium]|nr:hypothetical protein [Hyphomicrobiales bacterium]